MGCTRANAIDFAWLTALFVASSLWCATCAFRIGPTFDEPLYVAEGLAGWRTGSHSGLLSVGTMPLAADVQTLPLHLWETWRGSPIETSLELHTVLPWARLMTLAFWAMLLAYALLIGRRIAGVWGGRIAAALIAVEPNLLAHASLATTDLALTACIVATLYHFERGRGSPSWRTRVGVPALCSTLAVLAKASAIVFLPLSFVAIELVRLYSSGAFCAPPQPRSWRARIWQIVGQFRPLARDYAQLTLVASVLVIMVCGSGGLPEDDFVEWAHELPPGRTASAMIWVSEQLAIFPNAGEAFVRQVKHNVSGHAMYIAGHTGQRGVWYYFPLLLALKLPLPLLACGLALPLAARRSAWSWPLCCAAILLAYSFTFRVQIGVRMVLPIVALLAIGVAIALVRLHASYFGRRRWCFAGLTAATILLTLGSSLAVWPHGLCYANALAGGVERCYVHVSDSNYDWGQGVPDLLRWQQQRGVERVDVWYFGTDPQIHTQSLRCISLHQSPQATPEEFLRSIEGRYLAVGATIVHGGYVRSDGPQPSAALIRLLRSQRPVDRAGPFLIYDIAACQRWADQRAAYSPTLR